MPPTWSQRTVPLTERTLNRKDPSSRGIEHSAEEHWAAQRRVAARKSALWRLHQQTAVSDPLTFASEEAPSKTYWHAHWPPVVHCCLSAVSRYRQTFDKVCAWILLILFISFQVPVVHRHIGWWIESVGGSGRLSGGALATSVSRAAKRNRTVALAGIGDF